MNHLTLSIVDYHWKGFPLRCFIIPFGTIHVRILFLNNNQFWSFISIYYFCCRVGIDERNVIDLKLAFEDEEDMNNMNTLHIIILHVHKVKYHIAKHREIEKESCVRVGNVFAPNLTMFVAINFDNCKQIPYMIFNCKIKWLSKKKNVLII